MHVHTFLQQIKRQECFLNSIDRLFTFFSIFTCLKKEEKNVWFYLFRKLLSSPFKILCHKENIIFHVKKSEKVCGTRLKSLWNALEKSMERVWKDYRTRLKILWNASEKSKEPVWKVCRTLWNPSEKSLEPVCKVYRRYDHLDLARVSCNLVKIKLICLCAIICA